MIEDVAVGLVVVEVEDITTEKTKECSINPQEKGTQTQEMRK